MQAGANGSGADSNPNNTPAKVTYDTSFPKCTTILNVNINPQANGASNTLTTSATVNRSSNGGTSKPSASVSFSNSSSVTVVQHPAPPHHLHHHHAGHHPPPIREETSGGTCSGTSPTSTSPTPTTGPSSSSPGPGVTTAPHSIGGGGAGGTYVNRFSILASIRSLHNFFIDSFLKNFFSGVPIAFQIDRIS